MKKYQNEITIDFINKEVFLDSKSITIDALKNGEFTQSEYSPNSYIWSLKGYFSCFNASSDLIMISENAKGLCFKICFYSGFESHLNKTDVISKFRKYSRCKLNVINKMHIEIIDTNWSKADFLYHFRLGDITLVLEA